ncbi:MAG: aminoacyl-tRNA hydrolase [Anaerolineales bacterium]|nr:aminoacyl-tRNA hydrolase [Anaerolineales bacterium]
MLEITPTLSVPDSELEETFVRASGPGGQNVNKVATAVQLRFDVQRSPSLPAEVRARLLTLAAGRLTTDGVLIIEARRFRTQEQNRREARTRLSALIRRAAEPPRPRRATRVPAATRQKRLEGKRRRAQVKRLRGSRPEPEG